MNPEQLLEALLFKVHLLTFEQVAAGWMHGASSAHVRRMLLPLVKRELVAMGRVLAHPILPLIRPICRWTPEDPEPPFEKISQTLRMRWTQLPTPFRIVFATPKAANHLGGAAGKLPPLGHEAHDIHLAQIYVLFLNTQPERAKAWVGEDILKPARKGQKLPDAVIADGAGEEVEAIEFGGSYDVKRLTAFHGHCQSRSLPYELW